MPFTKVSYTYLHTLACPYQAFLRYEGAMRVKTTHHLALGNAVHLALEKAYDRDDTGELYLAASVEESVKLFLDEFNRIIEEDEVFVGYPQLKKAQAEGTEMIARYYMQAHSQNEAGEGHGFSYNPVAVEAEFKLPIAGIEIVGKIDKVEKTKHGLIVIDYKTGGKKPEEWFLRRNLQFTAYYWAAKEIYGEYPYKVAWHHLRTGELLESERTEWDIEQLHRIVEAAVTMQNQDLRYRVYHEQICNWCDFAGSTCDDPNLEAEILSRRKAKNG